MKIKPFVAVALLGCTILPTYASANGQYETSYYKSGAVHCKTPYLNGRKDGTETCFYETGIRKTEIVYENGTERLFTWYAPDGKPLMCNEFDAQHKLIRSKTWYASGVLKNITPYKDGVRHGLFREYDQDGSLRTEILYENDIPQKR